jgi:hypothetical protein
MRPDALANLPTVRAFFLSQSKTDFAAAHAEADYALQLCLHGFDGAAKAADEEREMWNALYNEKPLAEFAKAFEEAVNEAGKISFSWRNEEVIPPDHDIKHALSVGRKIDFLKAVAPKSELRNHADLRTWLTVVSNMSRIDCGRPEEITNALSKASSFVRQLSDEDERRVFRRNSAGKTVGNSSS